MRRLLVVGMVGIALTGCAGLQGPGGSSRTESDIISPPLVDARCMGAVRGTPIYSGPSTSSFLRAYTGNQVAATGGSSLGFTPVLYRVNEPGWVPTTAVGPFSRPGFPTVRCSIAGIRPDGGPVFFYH